MTTVLKQRQSTGEKRAVLRPGERPPTHQHPDRFCPFVHYKGTVDHRRRREMQNDYKRLRPQQKATSAGERV